MNITKKNQTRKFFNKTFDHDRFNESLWDNNDIGMCSQCGWPLLAKCGRSKRWLNKYALWKNRQ